MVLGPSSSPATHTHIHITQGAMPLPLPAPKPNDPTNTLSMPTPSKPFFVHEFAAGCFAGCTASLVGQPARLSHITLHPHNNNASGTVHHKWLASNICGRAMFCYPYAQDRRPIVNQRPVSHPWRMLVHDTGALVLGTTKTRLGSRCSLHPIITYHCVPAHILPLYIIYCLPARHHPHPRADPAQHPVHRHPRRRAQDGATGRCTGVFPWRR